MGGFQRGMVLRYCGKEIDSAFLIVDIGGYGDRVVMVAFIYPQNVHPSHAVIPMCTPLTHAPSPSSATPPRS